MVSPNNGKEDEHQSSFIDLAKKFARSKMFVKPWSKRSRFIPDMKNVSLIKCRIVKRSS